MAKPKKVVVDRRNFLKSAAAGAAALAASPVTVAVQPAELRRAVPPPMSPEAETGAARIGPPQLSFESFQRYVRQPTNQMPPYTSKAVPDLDLADIYAFLKTIPLPPKGKDIPLLNK
jgi:hypothetical protein